MKVWYSRDSLHLPTKIEQKTNVGTLILKIKKGIYPLVKFYFKNLFKVRINEKFLYNINPHGGQQKRSQTIKTNFTYLRK